MKFTGECTDCGAKIETQSQQEHAAWHVNHECEAKK